MLFKFQFIPRTVTLVVARMAGDRLVPLRKTLQVHAPFSASVILAYNREAFEKYGPDWWY